MKAKMLIKLFAGFVVMIILTSCQNNAKTDEQKIKEKLIGYQITYYNIAGKPVNYTVQETDIITIEKVNEGALWKVRVGESLAWDFYFDKELNIVKQEQLFRT